MKKKLWIPLLLLSVGIAVAAIGGFFEVVFNAVNQGGGEIKSADETKNIVYSLGGGAGYSKMEGGVYTLEGGFVPGAAPGKAPADNLTEAHAFPVPFRPDKGHTKITFTKLTDVSRIRVYTISGELVKTIDKTDITSDEYVWTPVVNDKGEELFSGVYIYYIDKDNNKMHRSGKLVIIK